MENVENNDSCAIVPMTYQEKYDIYMKLDKEQLVKMLIVSERIRNLLSLNRYPISDNCENPHRDYGYFPGLYKHPPIIEMK